MIDYLKYIDYSKDIKENPKLEDHIRKCAKELSQQNKDDENYRQPVNNTDLSNITIVTGLPKVAQDKVEKLVGFLKGKIIPALELPEPQIEFDVVNGQTSGVALFTFPDEDVAKSASHKLDNYKFDANHTIFACTNGDFDEMISIEDTYAAPKFLSKENLQDWLLDHRFREQLLVRVQNRHYLQWFDHIKKDEPILSGNTFADYGEVIKFEWSKSGSYLVTFHDLGFALWGGKNFEKLNFFKHPEVQNVEFSSCETYAISFNGTVNDAPNSENYIVWRVAAAYKIRSFKATQGETWGCYKWSFDSKYLASVGNDLLNIYELPSCQRILDPQTQKRAPLKIPNVQNLEWKPNKNILCIAAFKSQASKGESTGKIYLVEVPSRQIIKWKTITWEFVSCEINWETSGNKIVLVLKKIVKNKKFSTVIQIGEIKHNNVTVEEHEFTDAKTVNVDESGKKIAVLSQDPSAKDAQLIGYTVELYRTDEEIRGKYLQKIGTLPEKPVSHVLWSPSGTFFALVNTDKLSAKIGFLEFGFIKGNNIEIIKNTRIPYMIQASWDASGRFLCTSSSKGHYTIWTAFGEPIIKDNFTEITQIQWRPKPKIILPEETESKINSGLKQYSKKFEDEDDRILNEDKYKKEEIRKKQKEEFEKLMVKKKKFWEDKKKERVQLLGFDEDNMADLVTDEIIEGEEPIDTKK